MKRRNFTFFISPELFHQLPLPAVVSPHPPVCFFYFDSFSLSRPLQVGGVCAAAKGGGQREKSRPSDRQRDREVRSWRGVKDRERKEKLRCSLCSLVQKSQRQGDTEVASFLHQIACGRKTSNCKKTKKKECFLFIIYIKSVRLQVWLKSRQQNLEKRKGKKKS